MTLTSIKATGNKKTDILLFVHGAWHGAWCWHKYFMPFFAAQGYDTYALTLRKHENPGRIKGMNSVKLKNYVDDLSLAVKQLDQSPIIIGHSMGGLVLQKYLEKNTCKKAIFLAAVPPSGVFRLVTKLIFTTSHTLLSLLLLDLFRLVDKKEKVKWTFFSGNAPSEDIEYCLDHVCTESYWVFLNMLVPNVQLNPALRIPALALGAEQDKLFTEKENARIAKMYTADCIMLPNIAHDMMLDTNWENAALTIKDWMENSK